MNEQIKQIAEQCYEDNSTQIDVNKFAELLIQDCCKAIENWKKEPFPFSEDLAVDLILERFGLEKPLRNIKVIKI
jgi:hypothetical protein